MIKIKRRVIQIANSTQLISLPRKWATTHDIHKGDELEIEENGNSLSVYLNKKPKIQSIDIDIKDNKHYIKYILLGLYKRGYDDVVLRYNNPELISEIQDTLHDELIGFEIVEQKPNYCIIKSVADANEKETDVMIRRTFILLKAMSKEVSEAIINFNHSALKNLLHYETSNNKYTSFCRRIINKYGYKDPKKISYAYCIVETLERIADEYKHLINAVLRMNPKDKISPAAIKIYEEIAPLMEEAYNAYYKFDMEKAISIFLKRKELIKKSSLLPRTVKGRRLAHYSVNIAQQINDLIKFKLEMEL